MSVPLEQLIADIEAGKVAHVIVKDMSRAGRDYLQTGFTRRYSSVSIMFTLWRLPTAWTATIRTAMSLPVPQHYERVVSS